MVRAEAIQKSYQKKVLKNISFSVQKGECVGILGTNGCGKSTLLSILSGANRADKGKLFFNGEDAFAQRKLFSQYVAYVPQENPIIEELSVADNLKLWYSVSKRNLEEDFKNGLPYTFGLNELKKIPAGKLSGGMKKRLSIAGALSNDAAILILDEMGAALDLVCKEEIRQYLEGYKSRGGIIIMTTHEEEEMNLCSTLYALIDGELTKIDAGLRGKKLATLLNHNIDTKVDNK